MGYKVCPIGKSDAKKTSEQNAYNKETKDYVKAEIDLYIRSKIVEAN